MSADIVVISSTQRVLVDVPTKSATIVLAGPIGPTGLPGEVTEAELIAAVAALQAQLDDHEARLDVLEA